MTSDLIPITIVIPTRNEEANLAKCLRALGRFSEVVLIDSASTDATCSIAESFGYRVIDFAWNGQFPKKRNWYLLNHKPKNAWVLFLDADEIVTDAFCTEVAAAVQNTAHAGYWLNYRNYFLGKKLRFGIPQRKLALFRVGSGLYERIEEAAWSNLDMEIHEHPQIEGSLGELRAPIDHNDDRGILKQIERHREYAIWECARINLLEAAPTGQLAKLTSRQKLKYRLIRSPIFAAAYAIFQYFGRLGCLDGYAGLQYALLKFWYFNLIAVLLRQNREAEARLTQSSSR